MNKLILETQVSIDGFIADENGGTNWMVWNWGPEWNWDKELQSYHTQLNKSADAIIISSQMAQEGFNLHWQKAAEDPKDPQYEFARHVCDTQKYVVTTTLNKDMEIPGTWSNTEIIKGNLAEKIAALKSKVNGNLLVYGGATLVSNLISANLIDEYHLIINPVALGCGLPIFQNRRNFKLIKSITFECGVSVARYDKIND